MLIFFGGRVADVADNGLTVVFTLIGFLISSTLKVGGDVTTVSGVLDRSLSRYRLKGNEEVINIC